MKRSFGCGFKGRCGSKRKRKVTRNKKRIEINVCGYSDTCNQKIILPYTSVSRYSED